MERGQQMHKMQINDPDGLAKLCKALSHPVRIKIVEFLKGEKSCFCGDIVNIFSLSQSTISQHLKQLKESGIIQGEIEGPRTCYCLNLSVLEAFKKGVENL